MGRELLARVEGRCELVLHGHRHRPGHFRLEGPVSLDVLNAGSTTELGAFRVFTHRRERLEAVEWVEFAPEGRRAWARPGVQPPALVSMA